MTAYIYKITSPDEKEIYVGSTTCHPHIRWGKHRCSYERVRNGKSRKDESSCSAFRLFERYGYDNCLFSIIEETTTNERFVRERYWIDTVGTLNIEHPSLGEEDDKQKKKEASKRYAQRHPDKIRERSRKYAEEHKEEKKARFKAWYDEKKQTEEYQQKQAEKMKALLVEVECPCGDKVTKTNLLRHQKTARHQKRMDNLTSQQYYAY